MAPRYRDPDDLDTPETHGGEAGPRPLKSRRLVDMMETSSKGKGRDKRESAASVCRGRTSHLPSATEPHSPRQAETDFTTPKATAPERSVSKRSPLVKTGSPKTAEIAPDKPSVPDLPSDARAVLSVTPSGEGEMVTVVLALPDPEGKKAQRVSFHLLVEQYAELGVKTGEITPEYAETLLGADAAKMVPYSTSQDIGWRNNNLTVSFVPDAITDEELYIRGFDDRQQFLPGAKEAMRLLNKWYNEGLVWKDFALYGSGDTTEDDNLKAGFVGAFQHNYDYPYRNGDDSIEANLKRNVGPEAEFVAVDCFENDAGLYRKYLGSTVDRKVVV